MNQSIAVLRPRSDIATALQTLLHSAIKLNLFHSPRYNLIAWPFSGPYQNSNGWLLEVFARANDAQIWSRNDARRWLQLQGYQPSIVSAGTFERLGAKLFTLTFSPTISQQNCCERKCGAKQRRQRHPLYCPLQPGNARV